MPIKIDFLAGTAGLIRGTDDMADALEQVGGSLDELVRDAQRDASKIESEFDSAARAIRKTTEPTKELERSIDRVSDTSADAARDVQRDASKIEREFDGTAKSIDGDNDKLEESFKRTWKKAGEAAEQAGDKQRRESKQTTTAARADLEELGNEARQNAAETFSSFDGSAQSFVDGLQGTLGGIVSSLGPGGAIAGALGAIGLGFAVNALTVSEEAKQEFRESVAEMTGEFIEWGSSGGRSAEAILSQLEQIAQETDRGKTNLLDWRKLSGQIGSDTGEIAAAYLEGGDALDRIIEKTNSALVEERRRAEEITGSAGLIDAASSDRITNLQEESRLLSEQRDRITQARDLQLEFLRAGGDEYQLKVAGIESLNTAFDDTASAIDDFAVAEGGALDPQKYIDGMIARAEALANYKNDLATADLSVEAKTFLETQGVAAASRFMAGYKSATPEQQAQLNAIWSEAGRQNSGEYAGALRDGMPDTITGPTVTPVVPDLSGTLTKFQSYFQGRTVNVPTNFVMRDGRSLP